MSDIRQFASTESITVAKIQVAYLIALGAHQKVPTSIAGATHERAKIEALKIAETFKEVLENIS